MSYSAIKASEGFHREGLPSSGVKVLQAYQWQMWYPNHDKEMMLLVHCLYNDLLPGKTDGICDSN